MKTLKEPDVVIRNGKPTAVILPVKEYEALLESAADADDARWLGERRRKQMTFRSLEVYVSDRGRN
jgi:PHD/YefM family antitoxin component YafN of YafNO toxin-antitoxin module